MGILADHQIERDIKITPFVRSQKREGVISYGLSSYGYDVRLGYKFKIFSNILTNEIDPKNFDDNGFVEIDLTPRPHQWDKQPRTMREKTVTMVCNYCHKEVVYDPKAESLIDGAIPCPALAAPNYVRIPPNSFALGETLETIEIPRDVLGVCVGKSTMARCGIVVNVTPLEPEWRGKVTIEISNTTPIPARVYAGEGIMQVMFFRSDGHCEAVTDVVEKILGPAGVVPGVVPHDLKQVRDELSILLKGRSVSGPCRASYADRKGRYQDQAGLTMPFVEKKE